MQLKGENIGFRYHHKNPWVLKGQNFVVESGEIVGLMGPSGCGKTTLGRILAGYEQPTEGNVSLDGKPLPKKMYNPVQLVFQHSEKAVNGRWHMANTLQEGWEPTDDILEELGVEKSWMKRWPNELSGGELQRFCVARALGTQTKFLIADEMTTMLDAITQAQIWHAVLRVANERDMGVVVVSHEKHLMNRLCHRIVDLSK